MQTPHDVRGGPPGDRLVWRGPLGHKGLFYFLPAQMSRIARWVMRHSEERAAPEGG